MVFSYMYRHARHTHTHTHTLWHPCTDGLSYIAAWGCSIGFKNTHNICKALRLIILVLQCNHAIWAWALAEHEPYGKGDDEALSILMKAWGPLLNTHIKHTPQDVNFTHIFLLFLVCNEGHNCVHSFNSQVMLQNPPQLNTLKQFMLYLTSLVFV